MFLFNIYFYYCVCNCLILIFYSWKESCFVSSKKIRRSPDISNINNWIPSLGDQCECKAKSESNEPYGWWNCHIKRIICDHNNNNIIAGAYIEYDGWSQELGDTIQLEYLRPLNKNKSIEYEHIGEIIIKKTINVPNNAFLLITVQLQKQINNLGKTLIAINYLSDTNKVVVIGTKNSVNLAINLINLHFVKQQKIKYVCIFVIFF